MSHLPPRILLPGKLTTGANGVRGDSYSNGLKYAEAVARAGGVVTAVAPLSEHLARVASLVAAAMGTPSPGLSSAIECSGTSTSDHRQTWSLHDEGWRHDVRQLVGRTSARVKRL
jgi:hypothetical protein